MSDSVTVLNHPASGRNNRAGSHAPSAKCQVLAVTSGKGGVGKTSITTNLAIALAKQNARVCIFDADTNLANINVLLGITPEYTLEHFFSQGLSIEQISVTGPRGICVVPAASGIVEMEDLDGRQRLRLVDELKELEQRYDYLLIDTGAGIGETVMTFLRAVRTVLLVISPDPTSLTDAFSLLKVLNRRSYQGRVYVIVNMVIDSNNAQDVYRRFSAAVRKYLQMTVHYFGFVPLDESVIASVRLQQPVVIQNPGAPSARSFNQLAERLGELLPEVVDEPGFVEAWQEQMQAHERPSVQQAGKPADQPDPLRPAHAQAATIEHQAKAYLADEATGQDQATRFVNNIIDGYREHYHSLPFDLREILYAFVEDQGHHVDQLRDIILTLESVYEKYACQPVHDAQDTIMRLVADAQTSGDRLKNLATGLLENYQRQLGEPLIDHRQETVRQILSSEHPDQLLEQFHALYGRAYQDRYGRPPVIPGGGIDSDLQQEIQQKHNEMEALQEEARRLSRRIDSLVEAHRQLLVNPDKVHGPG